MCQNSSILGINQLLSLSDGQRSSSRTTINLLDDGIGCSSDLTLVLTLDGDSLHGCRCSNVNSCSVLGTLCGRLSTIGGVVNLCILSSTSNLNFLSSSVSTSSKREGRFLYSGRSRLSVGNGNAHYIDRICSGISCERHSTRLRSSVIKLSDEVGCSTISIATISPIFSCSFIITNLNTKCTSSRRLVRIVSNNNLRNIVVLVRRSCTCTSTSGCYLYTIVGETTTILHACPVCSFAVLCCSPILSSKDVSRGHVITLLFFSLILYLNDVAKLLASISKCNNTNRLGKLKSTSIWLG